MLVDAFRIFDILFTQGHQYACAILVLVYKLVLLNRGAVFYVVEYGCANFVLAYKFD